MGGSRFSCDTGEATAAARSEDVKNVTSYIGYIGEEIVLKAEVDSSWTLERIRWSIYSNFTRIATFENNEIKVNRWPPFKGRLEMSKSGDLTIKNLMANDSMEYTVFVKGQTEEKTSHVQLNVREQFTEPKIKVDNGLGVNKCIIELKCKSLGHNITLKWEPEPSFKERFRSSYVNETEELLMWTSFSNRDVNFFCIATDHNRNKTSHVRVKCPGMFTTHLIS
ncbi:uncharacterized protein si:cabz01074946.1 [Clarias gariepinus]|uniref:uncharacterized protein si:cabz01074946.1 n=1 Tax=Clarias gariepinus TaxID=13013 RepID=UPI00234E27ED|nr:uncharacterized protein si:cabz01074946.1 [Clarias gariepinus]